MRKLIIIFLFIPWSVAFSQQISFIEADTGTYGMYLRGDWEKLLEYGGEVLESDINYYYLQMRIAYAHFALNNFHKAAKHYREALKFNSNDPLANEYLYYSYLHTNRKHDALIRAKNLSDQQKERIGISDSVKILSLGLNFSHGFSNADQIQDDIIGGVLTEQAGIQKAMNSMNVPSLSFSHRLGRHIVLNHKVSYLQKKELSIAVEDGVDYISSNQDLSQIEYGVDMDITPVEGFRITPGIHYIRASIPLYELGGYGINAGNDRVLFDNLYIRHFVYKLELKKEFIYSDLGLSFAYHNINNINTNQLGIHTTIYPKGNLDIYLSINAYLQQMAYKNEKQNNYILNPLLGVKIHKHFWLETAATFPEQMNFYDIPESIAYNASEKYKYSYSISGIIPLYKPNLKIFLVYTGRKGASYFFPYDNMLAPINESLYNIHILTGGIKWTI